jgi:steroid delta-isomerase-like uncharacterized protein
MTLEENKDVVRRSVNEFFNTGNMAVVDEIWAADYVGHDPAGLMLGGREEFKQSMAGIYASIPDFHLEIDELIAEGDLVVKRWTARFTHQGEFMGIPPTGNPVTVSGTDTYRVAGGKLAECWATIDWLSMLQQLGAIPALG